MYRQTLGPRLRTLHGSLLIILPNPHRMRDRKEFYACVVVKMKVLNTLLLDYYRLFWGIAGKMVIFNPNISICYE